MSNFKPSRECEGCGSTDGRCRENLDQPGSGLCMSLFDSVKGTKINGKIITGHTRDNRWAIFAPDNSEEWTEEKRQEWEAEKERRQQKKEEERLKQLENELPAADRNKYYSQILDQLKLSSEHKQQLKERGLTDEQIHRHGYKSVIQWNKLIGIYPANLPGLSNGFGYSLVVQPGIIYPVRDLNGLIVGLKTRPDDTTRGKYKYLSSKTSKNPDGMSQHLNGELPLGVYIHPDVPDQPRAIALIESCDFKAFIAADKLNLPVVGAGGGIFSASPDTAKETLEHLSNQYGTKRLECYLDAGDVLNSQVSTRWLREIDFFQSLGYECQIAWWEQITKNECDIDELEDLSKITFITPNQFRAKAESIQSNVAKLDKLKTKTEGREQTKQESNVIDWAFENWKKTRKFTPDITINQKEFSFPPSLPESGVIVAVKSGLGTGKTHAQLAEIKRNCRKVMSEIKQNSSERGAIVIADTNSILMQTCERGTEFGLNIYHLQSDNEGFMLIPDPLAIIAVCPDSLHHLDGYFEGRDVYIDESCSVLSGMASGGTLGDRQGLIFKIFNRMVDQCNKLTLFDGNQSDIYVDFVAKKAPNKKVVKILNARKSAPQNFKIVDIMSILEEGKDPKVRQHDRSPIAEFLSDSQVKGWVFSDCREYCEKLHRTLKGLGREGYCLHRLTAGEPWAKDRVLKNPNKFFAETELDHFIFSPTASAGFSVTEKSVFTDKILVLFGVISINKAIQATARLRPILPHYVFCPEKSTFKDPNVPKNYTVQALISALNESVTMDSYLAASATENQENALEFISKAMARQDLDWFNFSAKLYAIDNYEKDNYRKCFTYGLEEHGHNVEFSEWTTSEVFSKIEKEIKEEIIEEKADKIHKSVPFDTLDDAKVAARSTPNADVQAKIDATYLRESLPGIAEKEVWSKEFVKECYVKDKHFISQNQRFYLLNNIEIAEKRHEAEWYYQATNENYFTAISKGRSHLLLWGLQELKILERFVNNQKEWHKDSPEVVELWNELESRRDIQIALRIDNLTKKTTGEERTILVNKLLGMIGIDIESAGRKVTEEGIRQRHYAINQDKFNAPQRLATLECLKVKFEKWLKSDAVAKIKWGIDAPMPQPQIQPQIQPEVNNIPEVEPETLPTIHELHTANVVIEPEIITTQPQVEVPQVQEQLVYVRRFNYSEDYKPKFRVIGWIDDENVKIQSTLTGEYFTENRLNLSVA